MSLKFLVCTHGKPSPVGQKILVRIFEQLGDPFLKSCTGDVISIHVFGKPTIVLNSYETAKELLDRRGALYIDRPRLVLLQEMYRYNIRYHLKYLNQIYYFRMGGDSLLALMRYGERFLSIRRMIRPPFNPSRITSFCPVQRKDTYMLLQSILKEPAKFEKHIERYSVAS